MRACGVADGAVTAAKMFAGAPHASLVVAAAGAPAKVKCTADYTCDGTDDQVQINAAIDAATTLGGTVQLSEGTFHCKAPVVPKSNVVLQGQGWASIIKHVPKGSGSVTSIILATGIVTTPADHSLTSGEYVLFAGAATMTGINGLNKQVTVTGARTFTISTAGLGGGDATGTITFAEVHRTVQAVTATNLVLRDFKVAGDRATCGNASPTDIPIAVSLAYCSDAIVERVWAYSGAGHGVGVWGVDTVGGASSNRVTVRDCKCTDNWGRGLYVQGNVNYYKALNNHVELNHLGGIGPCMNSCISPLIEGNTFLNNGDYTLKLPTPTVFPEIDIIGRDILPNVAETTGVIIRGNTIIRNDEAAKYDSTNGSYGILLTRMKGVIVEGNYIDTRLTKQTGICLYGPCIGNSVRGNTVRAAQTAVLFAAATHPAAWATFKGTVIGVGQWCEPASGAYFLQAIAVTGSAMIHATADAEPTWDTIETGTLVETVTGGAGGTVTWQRWDSFGPMVNSISDNALLSNTSEATQAVIYDGSGTANPDHDNTVLGNFILAANYQGVTLAQGGARYWRIVDNTIIVQADAANGSYAIKTSTATNDYNLIRGNRLVGRSGTLGLSLAGTHDVLDQNDEYYSTTAEGSLTGAGVRVANKCNQLERCAGGVHTTVLTFTLTGTNVLTLTAGTTKGIGVKVYDFPAGRVNILSCVLDAVVTTAGGALTSPVLAVGSATAETGNGDLVAAGEGDYVASGNIGASPATVRGSNTTAFVPAGTPAAAADLYVNVAAAVVLTDPATFSITGTLTIYWVNAGAV